LQQPGIMGRCLVLLLAISALAGCYTPSYPSETPAAEPLPHEASTPADATYRARRESAAGSGSSRTY